MARHSVEGVCSPGDKGQTRGYSDMLLVWGVEPGGAPDHTNGGPNFSKARKISPGTHCFCLICVPQIHMEESWWSFAGFQIFQVQISPENRFLATFWAILGIFERFRSFLNKLANYGEDGNSTWMAEAQHNKHESRAKAINQDIVAGVLICTKMVKFVRPSISCFLSIAFIESTAERKICYLFITKGIFLKCAIFGAFWPKMSPTNSPRNIFSDMSPFPENTVFFFLEPWKKNTHGNPKIFRP